MQRSPLEPEALAYLIGEPVGFAFVADAVGRIEVPVAAVGQPELVVDDTVHRHPGNHGHARNLARLNSPLRIYQPQQRFLYRNRAVADAHSRPAQETEHHQQ
jgi:hypothetical protein